MYLLSDILSPKISVVIPLYNKSKYISRALNSVLSQTFQDFEVIVVNDGSTDGGEKIVDVYDDSRIHLISQRNQGVSVARNNGAKAATYNLIAFLDADDEWHPHFLEEMAILYNKWPTCGFFGSGFRRVYPHGAEDVITSDSEDTVISEYFKYLCKYRNTVVSASTLMVSRELFNLFGGFDPGLHWGEDRDFYCRVALFYPVAYCPKPLANIYKETENNSSSVSSGFDSRFIFRVIHRGNCITKHCEYPYILEYSDTVLMMISQLHARNGDVKNALYYLSKYKDKISIAWVLSIIKLVIPNKVLKILVGIGRQCPWIVKMHRALLR